MAIFFFCIRLYIVINRSFRFQILCYNFSALVHAYLMASPFIESEWIGLGKEYNIAKIPEHVSEAKKQLLKIPDTVEALIPNNTMPLRDFLAYKLPTKSLSSYR
jgi:hypothetical protein